MFPLSNDPRSKEGHECSAENDWEGLLNYYRLLAVHEYFYHTGDTEISGGVCDEIFEEQLNGWHRVPSVWPCERDLKSFLFWFDCSFHSMVIDVSAERLRHTDM